MQSERAEPGGVGAGTLDPGFRPLMAALTAARARSGGEKLSIAWERENGCVARHDLPLPPDADHHEDFYRLAERVVKFLLWSAGGWRLLLAGPEKICARLAADYAAAGRRAFDADLMQRVFGRPLTVERRAAADMPAAKDAALALGGHLEGCRLGFDLGASDYKICATREGEVVFSAELPWTPRDYTDPEQHYQKLNAGLQQAAAQLPRVDAIGGSTAGVVVANRIMVASLFRAVPAEKYAAAQDIFLRLQQDWQVPVEVANDGDVTALAGALSLGVTAILGVAMGSSEAAGYLDRRGRLTGRLTELAFAPVDLNPAAAADEWSGDAGVGALYFSQQAVNKLAQRAGIVFPDAQPLPERLKDIQARMAGGDDTARKIYEAIGVYLGHAVPWYREFYDFDHLLILGRVTSGQGGEIVLEGARKILRADYPALAEQVNVFMPDEKARRVGQSVAAASLPQLKRSGP
jgi:predicted NBD/HSP70 family sugar kinase